MFKRIKTIARAVVVLTVLVAFAALGASAQSTGGANEDPLLRYMQGVSLSASPTATADEAVVDSAGTMFFESIQQCREAKRFSVYVPKDRNRKPHWEELADHGHAERYRLPNDACVTETTAMGKKILRLPKGTWVYRVDGKIKADGRCGNDCEGEEVPQRVVPPPPVSAPPPPRLGCIVGKIELYNHRGDSVLVVPQLTVTIGERSTLTDANGDYYFDNLPEGIYDVAISGVPEGYEIYNHREQVRVVGSPDCAGEVTKIRQLPPPPVVAPPAPEPLPTPQPEEKLVIIPRMLEVYEGDCDSEHGWIGRQLICHPVRTTVIVGGVVAAIVVPEIFLGGSAVKPGILVVRGIAH